MGYKLDIGQKKVFQMVIAVKKINPEDVWIKSFVRGVLFVTVSGRWDSTDHSVNNKGAEKGENRSSSGCAGARWGEGGAKGEVQKNR